MRPPKPPPFDLLSEPTTVDPKTVIWRYVDIGVAASMFALRHLSLRQLASMDDQAEGQVRFDFDEARKMNAHRIVELVIEGEGGQPDVKRLSRITENLTRKTEPIPGDANTYEAAMKRQWMWDFYYRNHLFASCWHINQHPNQLMWDAYGPCGIALKTTVGKLRDSEVIEGCKSQFQDVAFGQITYTEPMSGRLLGDIWPELDTPLESNRWWPGRVKDGMYKSEEEIRLLAYDPAGDPHDHYRTVSFGEIESLVDEVLIHPYAPGFLLETLQKVLQLTGSDVEIRQAKPAGYADA